MTKPEALKLLEDNHVINHTSKHPAWNQVFDFYYSQTGDKSAKQGCGSCHNKVLRWLRS